MIWLEFALIGSLAGFLAGYLGIGGGLVVVPALTWVFSRDPATAPFAVHMAVATSLATMLVTSAASLAAHQRKRAIRWIVFRMLTPGLLLGAVVGAWLADLMPTAQLGMVFGGFAALAGLQMLIGRIPDEQRPLPGRTATGLTGLVIGGLSSMVGIGGGSMTAPWLMWHGARPQVAVATAAACGYPIALAGSISFMLLGPDGGSGTLGYVSIPAFAGIAALSVISAPLGAIAVHRSPAGTVRRIFALLMFVVAARMFIQAT